MLVWSGLAVAAVAALLSTPAHSVDKRVNLTVYYQFTADSARFIRQQLYPTFVHVNANKLKRLLAVELVPYQNEHCESDPSEYVIWECLNDKLHACAASVLPSDWHRLSFVHCIASEGEKSGHLRSHACAARACVDDTALAFCVNSVDGDRLLAANVDRTRALGADMTAHPVVALDGAYRAEDQAPARENLLALLCARYDKVFDGFCDSARAKATMAHHNYGTHFFYSLRPRCKL